MQPKNVGNHSKHFGELVLISDSWYLRAKAATAFSAS